LAKGVNLRTCSVAASSGMVVTRSVVWAWAVDAKVADKASRPMQALDRILYKKAFNMWRFP
jgi:hypothetical protein